MIKGLSPNPTHCVTEDMHWYRNLDIDTAKYTLTGGNWQKWKKGIPDMSLP